MKYYIITLSMFFIASFLGQAQDNQNQQTNLNKYQNVVKQFVPELIDASMENYFSQKSESSNEIAGRDSFIVLFKGKADWQKSRLTNYLNTHEWSTLNNSYAVDLIEKYITLESSIVDQQSAKTAIDDLASYNPKNFKYYSPKAIEIALNYKNEIKPIAAPKVEPTTTTDISPEPTPPVKRTWPYIYILIVLIIIFLTATFILTILLIFAYKKIGNLENKLNIAEKGPKSINKQDYITPKSDEYKKIVLTNEVYPTTHSNNKINESNNKQGKYKRNHGVGTQSKNITRTREMGLNPNENQAELKDKNVISVRVEKEADAFGKSETYARVVELDPNVNLEELNKRNVVSEGGEKEANTLGKIETGSRELESAPKGSKEEQIDKNVVSKGVERENGSSEVKSVEISTKQIQPGSFFFDEFNDGIFKDRAKSEPYKCVYKITTNANSNDIIELIVDPKAMTNYIINKNIYLPDYLCDINYITGGNQTKIQNILPGKVRLENGEWKIQDKIKLEII